MGAAACPGAAPGAGRDTGAGRATCEGPTAGACACAAGWGAAGAGMTPDEFGLDAGIVGTADGGGAYAPETSAPAAARAATAAPAVGVIGRPQTPQNRAPSSISLEQ